MKKAIKIIGIIVAVIGVLAVIYFTQFSTTRATPRVLKETRDFGSTLTAEEARKDFDYLMKIVRTRHPAWLEKTEASKAVDRVFEEERAKIYDGMTVLEECKSLCRVLHELYDGHTSVYPHFANQRYASDFTEFNNPENVLTHINGEPVEDIRNRYLEYYQYDVEEFARTIFDNNVIVYETYLQIAGVDVSDGATYTFETPDGAVDYHYDFVTVDKVAGLDNSESRGWVYYDIDKENSIGIFTLTECTYNAEYRDTVKAFFEEVDANAIEHVIVDLRGNGGGSSYVANEFIKYLNVDSYKCWNAEIRMGPLLIHQEGGTIKNKHKNPIFSGDVYILTNTRSFSSAMDFAMLFADNHMGTIVGSACGNNPSAYGQCVKFQTPVSHLEFCVSVKRWHRVDLSKENELIEPDVPAPVGEAMNVAYELITS